VFAISISPYLKKIVTVGATDGVPVLSAEVEAPMPIPVVKFANANGEAATIFVTPIIHGIEKMTLVPNVGVPAVL
jgi:hypothetical protein